MFKRELVDISTGKHYVASCAVRRCAVGDHVQPISHQRARPRVRRRSPQAKTRAGFGGAGPLLLLAGAIGLFLVLHASSDHLVPVLIGVICIAIAFIGACKVSYDISTT